MKKRIAISIIFFTSVVGSTCSQVLLNEKQFNAYKNIPQEKLFIHYNSTLLFSGEYLYYKVYNLNSKNKKLSSLSKVAYVELIDKNTDVIFKHKIFLKSGMGQGDFFVPSKIPTGSYKLIAYTKWMLNLGNDYFFKSDINIINPYAKNQNNVNENLNSINIGVKGNEDVKILDKKIELELNKKQFAKRELVSLKIKAIDSKLSYGNYSISVKRIDSIIKPKKPNTFSFHKTYSILSKNKYSNRYIILPEVRGELITGKIFNKKDNEIAVNTPISLSISGDNPIFKISKTNESGVFYFNLQKLQKERIIKFIVMKENFEDYDVAINEDILPNYSNINFSDFKINEPMESCILERSIANQIENAYSSVKQDTIIKKYTSSIPFYKGLGITYNLDAYKRFSTVKEAIVEIINELKIQKVKGQDKILIKYNTSNQNNFSSLIIVDGLVLINHDDLINYDARKIETLTVLDYQYRYGGIFYDGIVSVETFNKDFGNYISNNYNQTTKISESQNNKYYFHPDYSNNKLGIVPDYRIQLLWEPNLSLTTAETIIPFFTSDFVGKYEINLEGFTGNGYPVSIKKIIEVEE